MKNRIGETVINNQGEEMTIVEYNNANDITVQFKKTGELVKSKYDHFKKGSIKSRLIPTVLGYGVTGFEVTKDENGKMLNSYVCWFEMLRRCYSNKSQQRYPSYIGCTVAKEWLYYPNFKKWYEENYYEIEGQRICLDKDILVKGNKVYSPETCIFVPEKINILFIKGNARRGKYPIGTYYHKSSGRYEASCSEGKTTHLGLFSTPEEAFNAYKQYKESLIKEIADTYRERIPAKLYNAMVNYTVQIND